MNINPEFNPKEAPSAVGAMRVSMQWIWENFVEPRKHELNGDDADMLAMVGAIFLDIASDACLLYTSPSPRDRQKSRMPSSA